MKQKLYGENIAPACVYCAVGYLSPNEKTVLCPQQGVVSLTFSCKYFEYNPLARKPKKRPVLQQYSEEDFSL